MATVLKFLTYRVVIYSNDHRPCHVHVTKDDCEAIFFLRCPDGPPVLRENFRFRKAALGVIEEHLREGLEELCNQWRKIHGHY